MAQSTFFNKLKISNISIKKQIGIISVIALVGMMIVGVVYSAGHKKQDAVMQKLIVSTQKLELIDAISYEFLNSRRSEKDFLIRRATKYIGKHDKNAENIWADIEKLNQIVSTQERGQLEEIKKDYNTYNDQFKYVVSNVKKRGLTHKEGLEGTLRKSVHAVETKLKEYNMPHLTVIMLMMRRHEKDFMMRKDPKYIKRMDLRLAEFNDAIVKTFIPADDRQVISKLMTAYHKDFKNLASIELENITEIKKLSKLFAIGAPKLDVLVQQIKDEEHMLVKQSKKLSKETFSMIVSVIIGVAVLIFVSTIFIGNKISAPIIAVSKCLLQLSEGNLEIDIPGKNRGDEVGEIAKSTEFLRNNSIEMRRLEEEQKQAQEKQIERARHLETLTNDFEAQVSDLISTLASASTELGATAKSMTSTADQTASQSATMKESSNETAANIQTVASASEELSASIRELSAQVQRTSEASDTAAQDVNNASAQIENLLEASKKIGNVVELIQDIAEQTNLLALNATIEAARAGDAGKGFAVVASEVKNLAQETSKATEQISEEVQAVQGEVYSAVDAIKNIESKIADVNTAASAIAAAVEEQNATTEEISRNTQSSAANMQALSVSAGDLNQVAQTTGDSAGDVLQASDELSQQTETLKVQVTEFLGQVKAA